MTQLSPLLTAVLLLNNFVVAQYVGLRPIKNGREVIGLGAATALALLVAAPLDWLLRHFLLQPLDLDVLRILTAALLAAALAQIAENILRHRQSRFFPEQGTHLPLIITNTLLLLLSADTTASLVDTSFRALLCGVGFALLLFVFQTLRERAARADTPQVFRGAALDMISAGLLAIAGSGLVNLW